MPHIRFSPVCFPADNFRAGPISRPPGHRIAGSRPDYCSHDSLAGPSIPIKIGGPLEANFQDFVISLGYLVRIGPRQAVPSGGQSLNPFGLFPQSKAGNPGKKSFSLHSPRIGQYRPGIDFQADGIEISLGRDQANESIVELKVLEVSYRLARPGVKGYDQRAIPFGDSFKRPENAAQVSLIVRIFLSVYRGQAIAFRLDSEAGKDAGTIQGRFPGYPEGIIEHVPDFEDTVTNSLFFRLRTAGSDRQKNRRDK